MIYTRRPSVACIPFVPVTLFTIFPFRSIAFVSPSTASADKVHAKSVCVSETTVIMAGKLVLLVSKRFVWPSILVWRVVSHRGDQTKGIIM